MGTKTDTPRSAKRSTELSMDILYKWDENPECYPRQIVTGDVTWLWQYDQENNAQPKKCLPNSGKVPVETKANWSRRKFIVTVFLDAEYSLIVDFLKEAKIVKSAYYESVLRKTAKNFSKNRGKLH